MDGYLTDYRIDKNFPAALRIGYGVTSCRSNDYNCIAWAAGESDIHWWPTGEPSRISGIYWPENVPQEHTLSAFIQAFATMGYCEWPEENGNLEDGYEKVVIYTKAGKPTHMARQLPNGRWTSKLGKDSKDIEHVTPEALASSVDGETIYGDVTKYVRRIREPSPDSPPCPLNLNAPCW